MYRKLALGLVAAASLTAAALAPTAASAKNWGGGGWGHHGWGHHGFGFGGVYVANGYGNGCYITRRVATPYGLRWRTFNVCY
ncbi:MAG: hypothetical protein K2X60_06145 [Xanthobacteraceae bacterium]|nr:hypothetical protein [Xanthobacteraceae bacterium]